MAAPRSGSTLLFETLQQSSQLWTLDDEGHALIERHSALRPGPDGVESNRLTEDNLTIALQSAIKSDLRTQLVNATGQAWDGCDAIRILEKTPKNILRIPFLNALFPDALFIYLVRDPVANIASIIEGWRSKRFVTYSNIQTRYGPWSFLLPPGWQQANIANLAEAAAWQWSQSHRHALNDLATLDRNRWLAVNYCELLDEPAQAIEKLCHAIGIAFDTPLQQRCAESLPLSRYTLEQPDTAKWQKHRSAIAPVLKDLRPLIDEINTFVAGDCPTLDAVMSDADPDQQPSPVISRNTDCPCGSGKKYKRCCGTLT